MPSADNVGPRPLPCDEKTSLAVVPLHNFPEFTDQCCRLLNMEWPRSRGARMNSLWSCSRKFPVALILVNGESRDVLGHSKLSKVPTEPMACFIESVVIHPDHRGTGLGSYLMQKVEHYVCSRKLSVLYLSTMGQENFYRKLGYEECGPVSMYGFGNKLGMKFEQHASNVSPDKQPSSDRKQIASNGSLNGTSEKPAEKSASTKTDAPSIDPCPPPPPPQPIKLLGQEVMTKKTYMKKVLTQPCNHEHKSSAIV